MAEASRVLKLAASGVEVPIAELDAATRCLDEESEAISAAQAPACAPSSEASQQPSQSSPSVDRAVEETMCNLPVLLEWLMARLSVVQRRKKASSPELEDRLILEYELAGIAREHAALVIQGMFKVRESRKLVRGLLRVMWEKRFDRDAQCEYYVYLPTELVQWEKPLLLGSDELALAPDEWRRGDDEWGRAFYANPRTGQSAWLSEDEAARSVQRCVRRKIARDYGAPTMQEMVAALRLQRDVERKFRDAPEKLSSIVNFALLLHTQRFDAQQARTLYKKALEQSPQNPILLRAYAVFALAELDAPRAIVFHRALDNCKNADLRDPGRKKFKLTEDAMFHWSIVAHRDHPVALLNYALLMQLVVCDYERAERFYHRALGHLPKGGGKHREMVVQNFELFELERLPGGAFYAAGSQPTAAVVRNSHAGLEKVKEHGEWERREHTNPAVPTKTHYFWLDALCGAASWSEPDWHFEHAKRRERSERVGGEKGGWQQFYDAKLEKLQQGLQTFYWSEHEQTLRSADPNALQLGDAEPHHQLGAYDGGHTARLRADAHHTPQPDAALALMPPPAHKTNQIAVAQEDY